MHHTILLLLILFIFVFSLIPAESEEPAFDLEKPSISVCDNSTGLIGEFLMKCDDNGYPLPTQIYGSTGSSWCVTDIGETIEGTQRNRNISRDVNCTTERVISMSPQNVTITSFSESLISVQWLAPEYSNGISRYLLHIHDEDLMQRDTNKSIEEHSYDFENLVPGTNYIVTIFPVYVVSGHQLVKYEVGVSQLTSGYGGPDRPCICKNETKCDTSTGLCIVCSPHTYKHSKADCKPCPPQCNASDITTGNCNLQDDLKVHCECKPHHTAADCTSCSFGYHHETSTDTTSCTPCPSQCHASNITTGDCKVMADSKLFCECTKGRHSASDCLNCQFGFKHAPSGDGTCVSCDCNGNNGESHICDPNTAVCEMCLFNTTGTSCELCAEGFSGNALVRECIKDNDLSFKVPNNKLFVWMVVVAILITVGAIVAVLYKRYQRSTRYMRSGPLNFFSVELRDDTEEGVDFSTLIDNATLQISDDQSEPSTAERRGDKRWSDDNPYVPM